MPKSLGKAKEGWKDLCIFSRAEGRRLQRKSKVWSQEQKQHCSPRACSRCANVLKGKKSPSNKSKIGAAVRLSAEQSGQNIHIKLILLQGKIFTLKLVHPSNEVSHQGTATSDGVSRVADVALPTFPGS